MIKPGALSVKGVELASIRVPIYRDKMRDDLCIFHFSENTSAVAVWTSNKFKAAPIEVLSEHVNKTSKVRYWIVNAGNANAGMGIKGLNDCKETINTLAKCALVLPEECWPFGTGVIGQSLPVEDINRTIPILLPELSADAKAWNKASRSIMTTDKNPKLFHSKLNIQGMEIAITGMAKGSGMIHPNMATMLAFIATDAKIELSFLQECFWEAVGYSFNRITVDGDTSTNDSCAIAATGMYPDAEIKKSDVYAASAFRNCLNALMKRMADECIRDAEGASKFIEVRVSEAKNIADAKVIANTVALSPLVKTAIGASDANWGRILAAVGRSCVNDLDIDLVTIYINDLLVVLNGSVSPEYTDELGMNVMKRSDIFIEIILGQGKSSYNVVTSDFTQEYVQINADYRN